MSVSTGKICPYCEREFDSGDYVTLCSACGAAHHEACWMQNARCTTLGCGGSPTAVVRASTVWQEPVSTQQASQDAVGKACPFCQSPVKPGVPVVTCRDCGIPHHQECWQENGGCTTFGCAGGPAGKRAATPVAEPVAQAVAHPSAKRFPSRAVAILLAVVLMVGVGVFLFILSSQAGVYTRAVRREIAVVASAEQLFVQDLNDDSATGMSVDEACVAAESAIGRASRRLARTESPASLRGMRQQLLRCLDRHQEMYRLIRRRLHDDATDQEAVVACWEEVCSDYQSLSGRYPELVSALPALSRQDIRRCSDIARRISEFREESTAALDYCDGVEDWLQRYDAARDDLASVRKPFEADPYERTEEACRAIIQGIERRRELRQELQEMDPPVGFETLQSDLEATIDEGIQYAQLVSSWAVDLYLYPETRAKQAAETLREARRHGWLAEKGLKESREKLAELKRTCCGDPMERRLR